MKKILLSLLLALCLAVLLESCSKKESGYDYPEEEETTARCGFLDSKCCKNSICYNRLICDKELNICKEKTTESNVCEDNWEQDIHDNNENDQSEDDS